MKIPANGFTHAGKFHADDVLPLPCCKFCARISRSPAALWCRTIFDGIVYDVGFGMFDHHQEPREYRANGVPYAAFGLLWRVLGPGLVGERQARLIDENFIQPLDLNDNTGEQNSLCDAIGFLTRWGLQRGSGHLLFQGGGRGKADLGKPDRQRQRREPRRRKGAAGLQKLPGRHRGAALLSAVEERPVQDGCVVRGLPQPARRLERPVRHRPQDQKRPKLPFPQSWAGQPQEVIEQKSGIPGISFCHASRFLITAKDKETALAACRQVLKNNGRI